MKAPALTLLVLASLGLGACSSLSALKFWEKSTVEPMAELRPFSPSARLDVVWQARIGSGADRLLQAAAAGDSVFAASADGDLTRVDAGKTVWRARLDQPLQAGVGVGGGLAVVGSLRGTVFAVETATGKLRWQVKVNGAPSATPLVEEDQIVLRVGDAEVLALDPADGHRRWVYQRSTPALSLRGYVGMRHLGDYVFVGFPGGKLAAVGYGNGQLTWEGSVSLPRGATELERLSDVVGEAVPLDRALCAASFQGRVSCFDVVKGTSIWGRELSSPVGIDTDSRYVYTTDERGAVYALDGSTGATVWKQDQLKLRSVGRPLALDEFVAVADVEGWVHLLRKQDGRFAARIKTDGSPIAAPLVRTDDGLVALTRDGGLFALRAR